MSPPLVTCIMPTRNRATFVQQGIAYFLRQDYAERELVVVDDGDDPVETLVPSDERIHYVRCDTRSPIGRKRNIACESAHGELIAHWDDDDWQAPNRLSRQVAELLAADADVCGATELLHYRLDQGDAWLYRHLPTGTTWLAGCTLLYRKSLWERNPFPEVRVGEDTAFVSAVPAERAHAITDRSLYVAVVHRGNTGAKDVADRRFERRPLDEVTSLLGLDCDFYVALRNGAAGVGAPRASASPTAVTLRSSFAVWDGYGSVGEYLALGMARAGAELELVPLVFDPVGLSPALLELLERSRPSAGAPVLLFGPPPPDLGVFGSPDVFVNTMWEASLLPVPWRAPLGHARAVIVPTRFVARVCRDSGVDAPIEVVPEGVDPAVYSYVERPDRDTVTTLAVAMVNERKHTREAIAAWKQAFADERDARLVIKSRFQLGNYVPDDARITLVDTNEHSRGIASLYHDADILLQLGSEGFGLPLVEGMATGLPAVALVSEGQADVYEDAPDCVLPVHPARWQPADDTHWGPAGVRGVPDVDEAAAHLRRLAGDPVERRELGRRASRWALAERDIWAKGPAVLDVMERYVRPPRPLRRLDTVWARPETCSFDPLADLLAALGDVRVTREEPDPRTARVVHVFRDDGTDDVELLRLVQRARRASTPVFVTELAVGEHAAAWEREADGLVATTAAAASRLARRWPAQRTRHVPLGCPPWSGGERAPRATRVVATIAERREAVGAAVVAAEAAGGDAVVVVPAGSAETESLARRARVIEARSAADAACVLAAEADAVCLWYDEPRALEASYAGCIAVASGVPVLASPTSSFADLADATYQPRDAVEGLRRLLDDTPLRRRLAGAARECCDNRSWPRIAERLRALWREREQR